MARVDSKWVSAARCRLGYADEDQSCKQAWEIATLESPVCAVVKAIGDMTELV